MTQATQPYTFRAYSVYAPFRAGGKIVCPDQLDADARAAYSAAWKSVRSHIYSLLHAEEDEIVTYDRSEAKSAAWLLRARGIKCRMRVWDAHFADECPDPSQCDARRFGTAVRTGISNTRSELHLSPRT